MSVFCKKRHRSLVGHRFATGGKRKQQLRTDKETIRSNLNEFKSLDPDVLYASEETSKSGCGATLNYFQDSWRIGEDPEH